MKVELFFVLNGLLDGERDVHASTCGVGDPMPDGWYWLLEGMDDGDGPYYSREHAKEAGEQSLERMRGIARGGIEKHLGDVAADYKSEEAAIDAIYNEAYTLAVDALWDAEVYPKETARLVAKEQAQLIVQP